MLQATYNNNTYTFYVTLADVIRYGGQSGFLFEFTNDMSGEIKWAYAQNVVASDRYYTLKVFSTQSGIKTESVIDGIVDLSPNGYWKYKIYQTDYDVIPCGGINPNGNGTWTCIDSVTPTPTVIDSGNLNVDVHEISNLVADTYTIGDNTTCDPYPASFFFDTLTQVISDVNCTLKTPRYLLFTKVVRNPLTNTFSISSTAPVGSEIRIENANRAYLHRITTNPENIVLDIACDSPPLPYTFKHYQVNTLLLQYNDITPLFSLPNNYLYRYAKILCSNNYYNDPTCSPDFTNLGSIFFAYNATGNTFAEALDGPLEIGKLYVEEQEGEQQVQYIENESPNDTNYIYND